MGIKKSGDSNNSQLCVAQLVETMTMGGAENLALRTANALAADGHRSHLIIVTEPGILSERIHSGVHVHYLGFWRSSISNPFAFLASLIRGLKLLSSVIEDEGIQVVQTHLPGANFWGLLLELKKACPILATIHNNQEFRYGDRDNKLLAFFRKEAYKQILNRCHGVVAVSEKVKVSLVNDLGVSKAVADKISVVSNGVEIPELLTSEAIREVRGEFKVENGQFLILAAGRFSEQKNFSDLIQVAAILRDRGECFHLIIGGDGEQKTLLQERVLQLGLNEIVSFPGNLNNLNQVMHAANVYVMPSLWEGLPLVLLEAMATGLPGVAYGIPGVDEVLVSGKNGIVVEVGKTEAMADALAELLHNPSLCKEMGIGALDTIKNKFSFSVVIKKLTSLYLSVTVNPPKSRID